MWRIGVLILCAPANIKFILFLWARAARTYRTGTVLVALASWSTRYGTMDKFVCNLLEECGLEEFKDAFLGEYHTLNTHVYYDMLYTLS